LSHRTGLPRHDFSYGGMYPDGKGGVTDGTIEDQVKSLKWLGLSVELRERFQYCNIMFVVASVVVERLTGMWLGEFLSREIWEKLGMTGTVSKQFSSMYVLRCAVSGTGFCKICQIGLSELGMGWTFISPDKAGCHIACSKDSGKSTAVA
jgi:CubicO group peptidase (beta-lactamase class C family)